jgi:hypothetical protein
MNPSLIKSGTVLKCQFPYDDAPHSPGPKTHFCLAVDAPLEYRGRTYVVVAYGTSRIDDDLLDAHQGVVLTVKSSFIKGDPLPKDRGHFVDHVALLPLTEEWILPFHAEFDFMTKEQRGTDPQRYEIWRAFEFSKSVMFRATHEVLDHFLKTKKVGILPGAKLR